MRIQGLIIDMDGVLWRGDEPIGNLPRVFSELQRKGLKFILATNNATRSIEGFQSRLKGFGVKIHPHQIINSPVATALYLKKQFPQGGNVFIIGESGLVSALADQGFQHSDQQVLAVVAGMDRDITYASLAKATLLIRAGVPFIGTNPDRTYPIPEGLVPGAGAILAAIEAATDCHPTIIGKPSPAMYEAALERMEITAGQALVVGDRLETDIAGAQALGCQTAVVLSGVSTISQVKEWKPPVDLIASNLAALVETLA